MSKSLFYFTVKKNITGQLKTNFESYDILAQDLAMP